MVVRWYAEVRRRWMGGGGCVDVSFLSRTKEALACLLACLLMMRSPLDVRVFRVGAATQMHAGRSLQSARVAMYMCCAERMGGRYVRLLWWVWQGLSWG